MWFLGLSVQFLAPAAHLPDWQPLENRVPRVVGAGFGSGNLYGDPVIGDCDSPQLS